MTTEAQREQFEVHYTYMMGMTPTREGDGYVLGNGAAHWQTWKAALSSLPRMTEEELAKTMYYQVDKNMQARYPLDEKIHKFEWESESQVCREDWLAVARAIIAKLPHIVKPKE